MSNANFTVQLIPGYNWVPGEVWTADKANLAANPTINVSGSFGSQSIPTGSVGLSALQTGMFTANTAGRAPFQSKFLNLALVGDGIFTADANGHAPFAAGWLSLALVGSGIFTATPAGRAPFAAGVVKATLVQPDAYSYAVDSGTSSAYVVGFTPALNAYVNDSGTQVYSNYWDGLSLAFKAGNTNTLNAGITTLNAGLGAATLYRSDGSAIHAGDILAHSIVEVRFNSTFGSGGGWQILTPIGNSSGKWVGSEHNCPTGAAGITEAHGLGVVPSKVRWVLVCTGAEGGWTTGSEIDVMSAFSTGWSNWISIGADATNVYAGFKDGARQAINPSTGVYFTMAESTAVLTKWKLKAYAEV